MSTREDALAAALHEVVDDDDRHGSGEPYCQYVSVAVLDRLHEAGWTLTPEPPDSGDGAAGTTPSVAEIREWAEEAKEGGYGYVSVISPDAILRLLDRAEPRDAGIDAQTLTDAINHVWRRQPGLQYAGFVYGETGAAVAAEYARLRAAAAPAEAGEPR